MPPSPNAQLIVIGSPSGSLEPALENATASGALPLAGVPAATATGARLLGSGVTVRVATLALFVSFVSTTVASESALTRSV